LHLFYVIDLFQLTRRRDFIAGTMKLFAKSLVGCVEPTEFAKWPGRAFEPCGLPDLPGLFFIWPNRLVSIRHRTAMDFAPWHAPPVSPGEFRQGKVLARRKPLLLLRFVGTLLLRFEERTFDA